MEANYRQDLIQFSVFTVLMWFSPKSDGTYQVLKPSPESQLETNYS